MRLLNAVINRFEELVVMLGLMLGTAATFFEVVLRYGFGGTTGFGGEFTNFTIIWAAMVGAAMGVRSGVHIGVDVLVKRMPSALAKAVILVSLAVSAVFTAFITYQGIELVQFSYGTGQVTSEMLFPRWPLYASVPVGMALMTYHLVQELWRRLWLPAEVVRAELSAGEHHA